MHFDGTVNLPLLAVLIPMGVGLVWKASQLVEEFRSLRQDFNQHVGEDYEHFERVETRLEELRKLVYGRQQS